MSTYDDQDERRERREREVDAEAAELERLDTEIRHAPAPGLGPLPDPPAGWQRSGRGTIERIAQ